MTESWSPLGLGRLLGRQELIPIARKHGKTPAQVVLRWHIEMGLVVIPKTATLSRISENFAIFDFSLDTDDLAQLDSLETSLRLGGDPETTNYGIN